MVEIDRHRKIFCGKAHILTIALFNFSVKENIMGSFQSLHSVIGLTIKLRQPSCSRRKKNLDLKILCSVSAVT